MQDYVIEAVREGSEWTNDFGTFQGFNLVLKGHGEPVLLNKKVPVNDPPKQGDTIYGSLEMKTSKAGKTYWTIKTGQKPPEPSAASTGSTGWHESPEKQDSINRAVALNNAVVLIAAEIRVGNKDHATINEVADELYAWLKGEKVEEPTAGMLTSDQVDTVNSEAAKALKAAGYMKAKAEADKLRKPAISGQPVEDEQEMPENFLK